jgi:hypothetical protein
MQLLPQGRYLIFSIGASGAVLYCSEINFDTQSTAFTRQERSHARQKDVPENTGTMPTYSQNLEGAPVQFIYGSAVTARDLTPDDDDLGLIEQKLFFNRYQLTGDQSTSADVGQMYLWAAQHRTLQDRFDAYQKYAGDNVSIQMLNTLSLEDFSYLTTTGLSMTGSTLGAISNCLIRSFSANPVRDIQGGPQAKILYQWTATVDQITIKSAAALS